MKIKAFKNLNTPLTTQLTERWKNYPMQRKSQGRNCKGEPDHSRVTE